MRDNLHIDSGLLQKYFEGKLSKSESDSLTALLEKDEFYREAFLGLNEQEFAVVEKISVSVNEKIRKVVGRPPLFMRWQIWLSIFIGIIAISSFVLLYDLKSDGKLANKVKDNRTKIKEQGHAEPAVSVSKSSSNNQLNETTLMFDANNGNDHNILSQTLITKKDTTSDKKKTIEEKKQDEPLENKVEEKKQNIKTDNPNTIDPGKKNYRVRIDDAAVINTQNLADKEASSGESRDNMDVTNHNIGSDLSKKRNTSYNLEDMPQYKGGTDALAAYVKGKIAIKSYTLKESSLSTIVEFVVTSKGKVEDIKFQNTLDPAMEKDIREVLSGLTFTPGKKSGKKGSMYYMMALVFGS